MGKKFNLDNFMIRNILFVFLFCLIAHTLSFANGISVDAYDEQRNNPGFLTLRLRVTNNTEDSLRNVQLKYNLPFDRTRSLQVQGYYLGNPPQAATLSMDTLGNTITLNINIAVMGPGSYPNQGGMSIGMYYADRQDFKKNSSACYPDTNTFANTEKIPVFIENSLALGVASSSPMGLIDSSEVYLFPNQAVPFAWLPIPGAAKYRLSIYNLADSSLVHSEITERTSSNIRLGKGDYLWNVEATSDMFSYQEWHIEDSKRISIDTFYVDSSLIHPIVDLHVSPLAARKDSPMLDLKWGELLDSMEWDSPHDTSAYIDPVDNQLKFRDSRHSNPDNSEGWRCWAVATTMINHYYKGNLTQDEIVFHEKASFRKDSTLHAFTHGGSGGGGAPLNWALALDTSDLVHGQSNLPSNQLVEALQHESPVAIAEIQHFMVVDACSQYEHDGKLDTLCRFLNTDNNGSSVWMNWASHSRRLDWGFSYVKEGVSPIPRMADTLIIDPETGTWRDSDGDGILDYDEIYRFHTYPDKKDSDNDGIEDKVEIWSYTRLEPYNYTDGVKRENFADIDNDKIRAEKDLNSDNDELPDGSEDINHNGIVDEGERSPYYNEDRYRDFFVPDYLGMYALNQLAINDGAKCYEGVDTLLANYCNVAAAGNLSENHTVNIGVRAVVGNVLSRGNFFLRSYSRIDTLYLTERVDDKEYEDLEKTKVKICRIQDSAVRKAKRSYNDSLWKSQWPILLPIDTFETSSKSMVVKAGDSLILNNMISYKMVRVESQGVLIVDPGEYWIGELQLHSGSRLLFTQPGKSSILHINGNVHWHPTLINTDYSTLARGFKLIHHGSINMFIETLFAGTIVAPKSNVMLGQSTKVFYGSVLAKNITLHQHSNFYHIPYKPN